MPAGLQSKLLRVLEERQVRRIGGEREIADRRAGPGRHQRRSSTERLRRATFREDLYFRLNVFNLHLPPLRERVEDIPLLAQSFLEEYATENGKPVVGISSEAMDLSAAP